MLTHYKTINFVMNMQKTNFKKKLLQKPLFFKEKKMKKFLLKIFNATVIMLFITVNQQFAFSQTMLDTIELEAVAVFETRTEYYTTGTNLNIISSNVLK